MWCTSLGSRILARPVPLSRAHCTNSALRTLDIELNIELKRRRCESQARVNIMKKDKVVVHSMSTPATRLAVHYLILRSKLPSLPLESALFAAEVAAQTSAHPQRTPKSWLNALTTARSRQQVPLHAKQKPSTQGATIEIEGTPEECRSSPQWCEQAYEHTCNEDTSPETASTAHHPPSLAAIPRPCPTIP